nr:ribonuclease H-like domain-containing protein [Tanacetum cinerariifolium]
MHSRHHYGTYSENFTSLDLEDGGGRGTSGDYDLWSMRMEQYLTHIDYALWEVIVNGDAPAAIASVSGGAKAAIPPKTTEQKIVRRNELKVKSTMLLAILDEHLLKFYGIKDAKTLWEAINTRFGGNKESKKMQKTILKQQYENFAASRYEGLDKTYDSQPNSPQLVHEDLEQIHLDDIEEMDLRCHGNEQACLLWQPWE